MKITLKDLLETVLYTQELTIVRLALNDTQEVITKMRHDEIPYSKISDLLYGQVVTVEARRDYNSTHNESFLYIEVDVSSEYEVEL